VHAVENVTDKISAYFSEAVVLVFRVLLGNEGLWELIFSRILLEPRTVLPAIFHRCEPTHFLSGPVEDFVDKQIETDC